LPCLIYVSFSQYLKDRKSFKLLKNRGTFLKDFAPIGGAKNNVKRYPDWESKATKKAGGVGSGFVKKMQLKGDNRLGNS
jgi:hypothetical protein